MNYWFVDTVHIDQMLWYLTFKSIEQQAIYVYICSYICSLPGKLHRVSNNLETLVYVNKYKENCFLWQKKIVWCLVFQHWIPHKQDKTMDQNLWMKHLITCTRHLDTWHLDIWGSTELYQSWTFIKYSSKENLLPWKLAPRRTGTTQRWWCWVWWWQIQRQGHWWSPAERRTPTWSVEPL